MWKDACSNSFFQLSADDAENVRRAALDALPELAEKGAERAITAVAARWAVVCPFKEK